MSKIQAAAAACAEEITQIRRSIHRHPETGWKEENTSALIRKKLAEYGVDKIMCPAPTAVVALIQGRAGEGRCVALRADIDALPIMEETGLPYASENPGVMHACGHDMHASMLLGAAKILCGMRDEFRGSVKLIFQHAEDVQPGGAKEIVAAGVLKNPQVDAIYAIHVLPGEDEVGKVCMRAGGMCTSVDIFDVTITGRGGHGSAPHTTDDPLLAACQMITLMQQIVARRVDPLETGIVTVGGIHGGAAPNVIPEKICFTGVNRAYNEEVRRDIRQQMMDIGRGIEAISGCKVEDDYREGYPALVNDAELVDLAREAVREELGPDSIIELERPMSFSEDFAVYNVVGGVPAAEFMICAGHMGDQAYPLHNPKCAMREEVMPYGVRTLVSIALKFLGR